MNVNEIELLAEKILQERTIESYSRFTAIILDEVHSLTKDEEDFLNLMERFKIPLNKLSLQTKNSKENILEHFIKNKYLNILGKLIENKNFVKKLTPALNDKPLQLYPLIYNFSYLMLPQKHKKYYKIKENIIKIESEILKSKNFKVTDFIEILLEKKNTNIFNIPSENKKLYNLHFLLKHIKNKNFNDVMQLNKKFISAGILTITSLILSGEMKPLFAIDEDLKKTFSDLNKQMPADIIKKVIGMNLKGLESVFNHDIQVNNEKLNNLINSSMLLIEMNKNNKDIMLWSDTRKLLDLLSNKKVDSILNLINERDYLIKFEETRRTLLERRMNFILEENEEMKIEVFRKKTKI